MMSMEQLTASPIDNLFLKPSLSEEGLGFLFL